MSGVTRRELIVGGAVAGASTVLSGSAVAGSDGGSAAKPVKTDSMLRAGDLVIWTLTVDNLAPGGRPVWTGPAANFGLKLAKDTVIASVTGFSVRYPDEESHHVEHVKVSVVVTEQRPELGVVLLNITCEMGDTNPIHKSIGTMHVTVFARVADKI